MKKSAVRLWTPVGLVALLGLGAAFVGIGHASSTGASVAQYQYGPTIALSPDTAPPKSTIGVTGSGFGPSETVEIAFDGTAVAAPAADPSGSFAVPIKIPSYATPGHHTVEATGGTSGLYANATLLVRTDWPTFRYSPQHSGKNPYENVLNRANAADLKLAWTGSTSSGAHISSSPAVVGGVVYVGSTDNALYAYDAKNHVIAWKGTGPPVYFSSPAVSDGVVYVGANDAKLYAFSTTTHALLWTGTTGGPITSSPLVSGKTVYVGSNDGKLYAFNTVTHTVRWTATTGGAVRSSPALNGNVLYVGSDDGKLYAFSTLTHAVLWTGTTGGAIGSSSPAVAAGVVYVGSADGKLYAFDASTHAVLWTGATGGAIESSPAVADGVVYAGSNDGKLYAFSATTHQVLWTGSVNSTHVASSPAVANGVVYIGSWDAKSIYAFPARCSGSCTPLWSYATGGFIDSSPTVVNGTVYIGSEDGNLYAFAVPSSSTTPIEG